MDNPTRICGDGSLLNGRVVYLWLDASPEEVTEVSYLRGRQRTPLMSCPSPGVSAWQLQCS